MREGLRVYIAGPFRADTEQGEAANIARAVAAGRALWEKGHIPFVPHTQTATWHTWRERKETGASKEAEILAYCVSWLHLCDGILMLEGWEKSEGSRRELDAAKRLGLQVFYSIEEIPDASCHVR